MGSAGDPIEVIERAAAERLEAIISREEFDPAVGFSVGHVVVYEV